MDWLENGRPEWIRTIDLFRVKNEVNYLNPIAPLVSASLQLEKSLKIA